MLHNQSRQNYIYIYIFKRLFPPPFTLLPPVALSIGKGCGEVHAGRQAEWVGIHHGVELFNIRCARCHTFSIAAG